MRLQQRARGRQRRQGRVHDPQLACHSGQAGRQDAGVPAGGDYLLGRGDECHVRFNSDWVSRQHCLVRLATRGRSSPPGQPQRHADQRPGLRGEQQLSEGDQIQVGPLTFEVTLEASVIEAMPEAPEPLHPEEDAAKRSGLEPALWRRRGRTRSRSGGRPDRRPQFQAARRPRGQQPGGRAAGGRARARARARARRSRARSCGLPRPRPAAARRPGPREGVRPEGTGGTGTAGGSGRATARSSGRVHGCRPGYRCEAVVRLRSAAVRSFFR